MKPKFLSLMLIMASCMCLLSCTSDNNEPPFSLTLSDVVGVWNVTEMTENGKTKNIPSGQVTIDLDNDNSYQVKFFSNTYIGTYHLSENTVIGTTLDPITERFKFTKYDGINATIQYSNSVGDKYIFKATKKTYARVSLNYTFAESGSMSRTAGNDVYTTFFDKYIKTKQLTPTTYSLTFTNTKTGAIALVDGRWDSNDGIRLPEGTYKVEGISHRIIKSIDSVSEYVSDTTFISFNEEVSISPKQTILNLTAQYDSYLLIFDSSNISTAEYIGISRWNIKKHDNLLTIFVNRQSTTSNRNDYIKITRTNGSSATIYLKNIPFEKGKYYYFNDMTNSFDIPKMESGTMHRPKKSLQDLIQK